MPGLDDAEYAVLRRLAERGREPEDGPVTELAPTLATATWELAALPPPRKPGDQDGQRGQNQTSWSGGHQLAGPIPPPAPSTRSSPALQEVILANLNSVFEATAAGYADRRPSAWTASCRAAPSCGMPHTGRHPAVVCRRLAGRPGGHHAAQCACLPDLLLWCARSRSHRHADEPTAESREIAYSLGGSGAKALFAWHAAAGEAAIGAAGTARVQQSEHEAEARLGEEHLVVSRRWAIAVFSG
jgi:hypothetical protein